MVGIYKITNKINQKIYIGQSVNISKRWTAHRNGAFNPNNGQYNTPLYKAIRKYGIENFTFEILEECAINELDIKHSMFADAIFAIVSNVNEEKIEVWKEEQSMNDAMRRIMAKELKESRDEGRSEERNMMKEAMLTAKKEHISDASQLEALGFDVETSHSTIAILRELGVIS